MNLINKNTKYDNQCYFCTWLSQDLGRSHEDQLSNTRQVRDLLDSKTTFGTNGTASAYPEIRKNLFFLLDDGWDVGYGLHMGRNRDMFGSLIVNTERFPECTGTPAERLKKLNESVIKKGWRGLGIWICSNALGETVSERFSPEKLENYYRERMLWCREAGVFYWKVDWGHYERSADYRYMLNKIAEEVFPELIIEHAGCCQALNGTTLNESVENDSGRFSEWDNEHLHWAKIMSFSKVFRTYDVINQMSVPTTLDRVYEMLRLGWQNDGANCTLNCEDELYLGAAFGLNLGIMRSKLWNPVSAERRDPTGYRLRTTEAQRAMNWLLHFAPVMGVKEAPVYASEEILFDSHKCEPQIFSNKYKGKNIRQGAPAVISRGCTLPEIKYREALKPFIALSRNKSGAYALASFYRKTGQNEYRTPLADTVLAIDDISAPTAVFGYHGSVTLKYPVSVSHMKVYIQDLAGDTALDITDRVKFSDNRITVDGSIIAKAGTSANPAGDRSEPGAVIRLIRP